MKKIITISLAVFYLFVASGVFINLHFCGDHLKKIAFYTVNDEDGCCGSEEKDGGCCKNESAFFKVKDDHHSSNSVKLTLSQLKIVDVIYPQLILALVSQQINYKKNYHDPPVFYDNPLYLKHKVLII